MTSHGERIFADQYKLDVQIATSLSTPVWRAVDQLLNRPVTLVLLPTSDLRSVRLLQRCQVAAANDRRDVIAILDVISSGRIVNEDSSEHPGESHETYAGVIFEWLDGESLDRLLMRRGEVFDVEQALQQVGIIANTLAHSHSLDIFHQRLRPHNLVFSQGQDVRLSGFGLDSALMGTDSGDPLQVDIKGVGNLLFAMVTGMWPLEGADLLPAAKNKSDSEIVLPSEVHGGVGIEIDQLYQRTQTGEFLSMRELINALSVGEVEIAENLQSRVTRFTANSVTWQPRTYTKGSRIKVVVIAVAAVFAFGWVGWQLLTSNFQGPNGAISAVNSASPSSEISTSVETGEIANVIAISPYDPFGDNAENAQSAELAIDDDMTTAQETLSYRAADMGKSGVGLLLDLGSEKEVAKVEIYFTSPGQSAEIYVGNTATLDFETAAKFGQLSGGQQQTLVVASQRATGR